MDRIYCWLLAAALCCQFSVARASATQDQRDSIPAFKIPDPAYTIGNIIISGNKKTKPHIVLREIPFREGEVYTLKKLVEKFGEARRHLMNTTLFEHVVVAAQDYNGDTVNVAIELKERWYLFPVPYFKPVDRNLNQWLVEQNGSLSRVNYGLKILYNNATGRRDKFRFGFINGYTRQFSMGYDQLYIDKQMKWGMNTGFAMGKNREVNYITINDKQVFLKDNNNYLRSFYRLNAELTYRKNIKTRHNFGLAWSMEEISDTIFTLNPSYFKTGHSRMHVPSIFYGMNYQDLDYIPYPTKGYMTQFSISKSGFNKMNNLWQLHLKAMGSWPVSAKTFFSLSIYGGIKLPFDQPYINRRFLGYDVFLQGYEYYVIDGVAGGYLKTTLSRQLLAFQIKLPPYKKGKEAERIPFRILGKIYGNTGYVHDPDPGENILSNKLLYSGGLGIDIVTFYDIIFRFEWTFNQLGQNGLFLHRNSIF